MSPLEALRGGAEQTYSAVPGALPLPRQQIDRLRACAGVDVLESKVVTQPTFRYQKNLYLENFVRSSPTFALT